MHKLIFITIYVAFFCFLLLCANKGFAQYNENNKRIWAVEFEGNIQFEDPIIERYISNQRPSFWKRLRGANETGMLIDEYEIRKDVIRIERFYQRRGYPNVEVRFELRERSSRGRKKLVFLIQEHKPLRINTLQIITSASKADKEHINSDGKYLRTINRLPFREGKRYQVIEKPEVVSLVAEALNNLGYIYATVTVEETIDTVHNLADIKIVSTPGPKTIISSFNIEGEETLDKQLIFRETGLKLGQIYSAEKIREAQKEVYKHHLFRLALVSVPDQPKDSTLDLTLTVKEWPLRSFRVRVGFSGFDRLDAPLALDNFWKLFRAQSTWIYRNVGGKGNQFSSTIKLSFFESFLSSEFLFPYVFNTKSSFKINPFIENRIEPAYSITTGGLINSLGYEYNRNLTGILAYEYVINNEYDIASEQNQDITQVLPDSVLSYNISSFSVNLYYAKGLSRGKRGWIIQPYIQLSGILEESDFSYQKLAFNIRKFTELYPKLVLATRVQAGTIYFAKQDSLPADIEFYAGGTSSVRAYKRNSLGPKKAFVVKGEIPGIPDRVNFVPIGGKAFITFNFELRQQLDKMLKGFGIAAFLDGGQVWTSIRSIDDRKIQYSTGVGIRYETPIGPVRIDFGYKLNPTDYDLELFPGINEKPAKRWRLHINVGQAF